MKTSLHFMVYDGKQLMARCRYASDAATIVGLYSEGSVKHHRRIIYQEGIDGEASASYDEAAETMIERVRLLDSRDEESKGNSHDD